MGEAVSSYGFEFHHAKPEGGMSGMGYVMLTKWIPETPNKMPRYASHYIGVGGLVLSKDGLKMLAILETKPLSPDVWKLPGGAVDPGESI